MKDFYPPNQFQEIIGTSRAFFMKLTFSLMLGIMFFPSKISAQQVFTILEGEEAVSIQGISPFATTVKNQRSQYLYTGDLLQNLNAPNGYITAVAVKITQLALPSTIQPQNLQIKMGSTTMVTLPADFIPNLPIHYSSATENITSTGWYTFNLDTPFSWDGFSNVVIEFCRTNVISGDSFEVEVYLGLNGEYRTTGLVSNVENGNGCTLSGTTTISLPNRRLIPSMQVTMTNPCESNPSAGIAIVSEGNNYCGEPFTLSVTNETFASGLSYQWQASYQDGTNFVDIPGATLPTLTTSQDFATYYRRGTMCDVLGVMVYNGGVYVAGPECYCNPTVSNEDESGITNVTFDGIGTNSSSEPFYTDFTNTQFSVAQSGTYTLSARVSVSSTPLVTKAWIDWNQDGNFAEGESYNLGVVTSGLDVSSGISATVMVPQDALLGSTRMRVRTATVDNPLVLDPCANTENGESEDYKILVTPGLGVPNADLLKNSIVVYSANKAINVKSTVEEINNIKIFDISGRLIHDTKNVASNLTSISLSSIATQIVIVEIQTISGFTFNKLVSVK